LELIHFDVFSPIKVPLKSKALYYVSIIDDHFKRTWAYFLRTTYEAFIRFKEFKALLENKFGRKIKVSRIDNGGEFCFLEFAKFCKENGIERHNTSYTLQ
jgi:hypothetical protein